jgi:nitrite reductase/ring-hydroxylating ferredoxin subunit
MFKKQVKWVRLAASKADFVQSFPPSGLKRMVIERRGICFVNYNNDVFAVADRCPHQGGSLSEGSCTKDGFVVCPWHRYGYDIKNGRGPGYYVDTYPIEMREEGLFVGIKKGWLEM